MDCPVCKDTKLTMADRQGVEIDFCPNCRGVWLDRGELDKIIERAATDVAPPPRQYGPPSRSGYQQGGHYGQGQKHKRKSLLKELFDF